jgi:hypothetical protein
LLLLVNSKIITCAAEQNTELLFAIPKNFATQRIVSAFVRNSKKIRCTAEIFTVREVALQDMAIALVHR